MGETINGMNVEGVNIEKKILQKKVSFSMIKKEREEKLNQLIASDVKRKPYGGKVLFYMFLALDHKLAVKIQEAKTGTIGQPDSDIMLEIMNLIKKSVKANYLSQNICNFLVGKKVNLKYSN